MAKLNDFFNKWKFATIRKIFCIVFIQFYIVNLFINKAFSQYSPHEYVQFQFLTSNESYGLGNIWDIMEDHEGFIWFATEDGLIKFDGYELTSFKYNANNPHSISSNFVLCLFEDDEQNFWIGTLGGGLNLYSREENRFYHFIHDPHNAKSLPNNRVKSILQDKDGKIWMGTEGGGLAMIESVSGDLSSIQFKVFNEDSEDLRLSGNFIRATVTQDRDGNIYAAAYDGGINVIDSSRKSITYLQHENNNPNSVSSNIQYELFVDSRNRLWIGNQNTGIDLFLIDEKEFIHYRPTNEEHTLNNGEVESFAEDEYSYIWVGTDNGLSLMLDSKNRIPANDFTNFLHEPLDENSILSNSIKKVYVDSNNSLWVSSYYGGINMYNPEIFKFTPIRNKPWIKSSLPSNNVTAFEEDDQGNLWIGTDGGGLSMLSNGVNDIYKNEYQKIRLINPETKEPHNKIKSLHFDENQNLWVGTWGSGLFKYDIQNGQYAYFGIDENHSKFVGYSVNVIELDQNNNIWLGTLTDGVSMYDQENNVFNNYLPTRDNPHNFTSDRINSILVDSKNRVWIGGELGGLNLYDRVNNSFSQITYQDILTDKINILSMMESRGGKLWIGTLSGAIVYDPGKKDAMAFSEQNGLPDNVIHGMLEDKNGNIWMSTNHGIVIFDVENNHAISFDRFDGLQGNRFNNNSLFETSNGLMLFGGTNGWNGCDPNRIRKVNKRPEMVLTKFYLNGELMPVNTPGSPLTSHLNSGKPIVLEHDQNNIGFEFAALEYNFSNQNKYAYLLEGLNDEWQEIGTERRASFTNIFPGTYKLRIRATNKDGFWHEMDEPLTIRIHPAWWQTSGFKILVGLCFLGVGFLILRLRTNYLLKQRDRLQKTIEVHTSELQQKNQELSNMNYEFQAQNEELSSQNDQIAAQREELEFTQEKLREINRDLEDMVEKRTMHLEETIKKLDKTVEELDRFVYSASHDLSAPIKSIRGLIDIAFREKEPEKIRECLTFVKTSVNRFEDVIKSLVDYARNVHFEVSISRVNVHQMVDEVFSQLKFWPEAMKVDFKNQIDEDLEIDTDPYRLSTILHNLINNGLKYSDARKENPYLKVDCQVNDHECELQIEDNGIGIDKDYVKKIFDMYYRASEKSTGSGLGLFIVKESVQRLGGEIKVISEKGEGTRFMVKIPRSLVSD